MKFFSLIIFFWFLTSSYAQSQSVTQPHPLFKNIGEIKLSLGFTQLHNQLNNIQPQKKLKVAILDKGFDGFSNEIGKTLPLQTIYKAGPIENPTDAKTNHGLRMAQIFTALVTDNLNHENYIEQLYLYNVFGFTNFKNAIDDLIQQKVDLVLYSEVWEYGGNFDGQGFINNEINKVFKNNILWINAAGNFNTTTHNTSVRTGAENWVQLPDQNQSLKIICKSTDKCPVKIVLSWNDFKNNTEEGTNKDLDFVLTDDFLNIIQSSSLKQSSDPNENRNGYSKYPREIITAELNSGTYFIRVKNRSLNFDSLIDKLRITVDGLNVSMPSNSKNETILNPADNPLVITVGALDTERSSTSVHLQKPDIWTTSSIILNDNSEMRGSSNAAAIAASGVALKLLTYETISELEFDRAQILRSLIFSNSSWNRNYGLSLYQLGFNPTGPQCFKSATPQFVAQTPPQIQRVLKLGGVLVETTMGYRIMTPYDPILLNRNLMRYQINDIIATTPQGFQLFNRFGFVPQNAIEVFQRPVEVNLCDIQSQPGSTLETFNIFKLFQ